MATAQSNSLVPLRLHPNAPYGSAEWQQDVDREIAMRPRALPLNQRKSFTPAELDAIRVGTRANLDAGMPLAKASAEAIKSVVALRT